MLDDYLLRWYIFNIAMLLIWRVWKCTNRAWQKPCMPAVTLTAVENGREGAKCLSGSLRSQNSFTVEVRVFKTMHWAPDSEMHPINSKCTYGNRYAPQYESSLKASLYVLHAVSKRRIGLNEKPAVVGSLHKDCASYEPNQSDIFKCRCDLPESHLFTRFDRLGLHLSPICLIKWKPLEYVSQQLFLDKCDTLYCIVVTS